MRSVHLGLRNFRILLVLDGESGCNCKLSGIPVDAME